jgi:hypothetical protein
MNEMLGGIGRTVWIVAGIAVIIGAIFGLVWFAGQMPPSLSFSVPHASCNFASTDASASYSATIIAGQNYNAAANAVATLIAKHDGELLGQSSSEQPYQNDAAGTSYTNITSAYVSGNIPLGEAQSFMSDVAALAPLSSLLQNINYSKTTGNQLQQNCTDDLNSIKSAEALNGLYLREMMPYLKTIAANSSTATNQGGGYYPTTGNANLDDLNGAIQSSYSNISSNNDNIAQLHQNLNKVYVSVTVQDKPQPIYPPNYNSNTPNTVPPSMVAPPMP